MQQQYKNFATTYLNRSSLCVRAYRHLFALLIFPTITVGFTVGITVGWAANPALADFTNVGLEAGVDALGVRGAAWGDYDGDGCVDLLLTGPGGVGLLRNRCDGSGTFVNRTAAAGLSGPNNGWGAAWADFDNDGDLDVYVAAGSGRSAQEARNGGSPNALYRNNGDGTFTDIAAAAGVNDVASSTGASWADYDNDGDLDLYVANRVATEVVPTTSDRLFRNNGDSTFTNMAFALGVAGKQFGQSFMGVWIDYDRDGDQDLYVAVDFDNDRLYRNDGGAGFTNVTRTAGIVGPEHGMGIAVGDLNADGCLDLFSTNNTQEDDAEHGPSALYLNNCDGTFSNAATSVGVLDRRTVEWGPNFIDFDNDGDLDLAVSAGGMLSDGEPNVLYENRCDNGLCALHDITDASGVANAGSAYGSAWADYDNDGDLDWFVANSRTHASALFRNDGTNGNYLKIKLTGTTSNINGVGALIELSVGDKTQITTIQSGQGYASDGEQLAFFGLGAAEQARSVRIFWPSGTVTTLTDISANQLINVVEGETQPTPSR